MSSRIWTSVSICFPSWTLFSLTINFFKVSSSSSSHSWHLPLAMTDPVPNRPPLLPQGPQRRGPGSPGRAQLTARSPSCPPAPSAPTPACLWGRRRLRTLRRPALPEPSSSLLPPPPLRPQKWARWPARGSPVAALRRTVTGGGQLERVRSGPDRPDPTRRGGATGSQAGRNWLSGLHGVPKARSPTAAGGGVRSAARPVTRRGSPASVPLSPAEDLGTRKRKNESRLLSPDLRIEIWALGKENTAQLAPFWKTFLRVPPIGREMSNFPARKDCFQSQCAHLNAFLLFLWPFVKEEIIFFSLLVSWTSIG